MTKVGWYEVFTAFAGAVDRGAHTKPPPSTRSSAALTGGARRLRVPPLRFAALFAGRVGLVQAHRHSSWLEPFAFVLKD